MASGNGKCIVGLEVGSSKVVAVVGERLSDGVVNILGVGSNPSKGISQGGITDLEAVVDSIRRAINSAATVADYDIKGVILSITGEHIGYRNENGQQVITSGEVTEEDIFEAMYRARSVKLNDDMKTLQVIPQEYDVDGRKNITNPLGLQGVKLTAQAHLITCNQNWLGNLIKAVKRCELDVDDVYYSGFASGEAVLTEDEKKLGVCLLDFGAGTIDISVYTNGKLRFSKVLTYAGNRVTEDITQYFSIPFTAAEEMKVKYGSAMLQDEKEKYIEVAGLVSGTYRACSQSELSKVITSRYAELLNFVKNEISKIQQELDSKNINSELAAGIVITGGGAQMNNLSECAKVVFVKKDKDAEPIRVRIGKPTNITGLTDYVDKPQYSTVVGLLHCAGLENNFTMDKMNEDEGIFSKFLTIIQKITKKVREEF